MTVTHNTNREATAESLLIDLFQSKDNFVKLLSSYVAQTQELEDVFFELLDESWLDTAVGVQLDGIGEIVGADRDGASDDVYRLRIKARVQLNLTSGTPNQILAIVNLLMPVGAVPARYIPYYPAGFEIDATGTALTAAQASEIGAAVLSAAPAGVKVNFIYGLVDAGFLFTLADGATSQVSSTMGFADLTQTTGGRLAGVYTNGN